MAIRTTLYTDPVCPWAYSASPALRVLEWRYGDGLDWRLVVIGLRDAVTPGAAAAFDAARRVQGQTVYRQRYGMPFGLVPKARASATGRGCRAVVAARLLDPGSEWRVLRALQLAHFTTALLLDDDDAIRAALRQVPGIDADGVADGLDDPEVAAAYEADKAEARTAVGTAAEVQGKTSTSDGPVRFTAPSVVFERDGQRLVAGGWQPLLAYDVLLANLDSALPRTPPPPSPLPLLDRFPDGLTTAEVAALLADGPDPVPDLAAAERALVELVADGLAARTPLGQDALWTAARSVSETWRRYYDAAGLDPRETLLVALERFDGESRNGVPFAVDLGCGTGRDTLELLRRGWRVLAIDSQTQAIERLLDAVADEDRPRLDTRVGRFEDAEWPAADLVNSSFALPFCARDRFGAVWERVLASLPPGGRFSGQLFGDHDEWASGSMRAFPASEKPEMTFLTRAEVEELLQPLEVEHLVEVDEEGATAVGVPKHWHLFHVVARKR